MKTLTLLLFLSVNFSLFSFDLNANQITPTTLFSESILKTSKDINSTLKPLNRAFGYSLVDHDDFGTGKFTSTAVSIVAPGVGLYMASKNPATLLVLPICYGVVGYGGFQAIKSNKEYDNYLLEKDPFLQSAHFERAQELRSTAQTALLFGLSAWILQTAWTYVYGSYNDIYKKRNAIWKNNDTAFRGGYDFQTNTAQLGLTIKI